MIDIHSHILPSVDDGAANMEEAIKMCRIATQNGTKKMFATPHYIEGEGYNNSFKNTEILNELNKELKKNNIDLEVFIGNELFINHDPISFIDNKEIATLNNTRYLLMEFPRLELPVYVENVIYNLRLKGIIPIIAHPERYVKVMEDINVLHNFITKGALCQLNLPSLEGRYGERVKVTAIELVKHDMIHFVGSDAHSSKRATPKVDRGIEILSSLVSEDKLRKLLYDNPEKIINNEDIVIDNPKLYKEDGMIKKLFKKIRG